MATLPDEVKEYIVRQLAAYDTPTQVALAVKETFGIEVSRQRVYEYHPYGSAKRVAKKWKVLFDKAREAFLKDTSSIPIANRAYRLKIHNEAAQRAMQRGNWPLAMDAAERAAKEVGGSYTNQRQVTGKDGRPVEYRDLSALTDEQVDARLKELLAGRLDDEA